MYKNYIKKIKIIWDNLTLIRIMRITIVCLIVLVTKNLTIKISGLDISEFLPFIIIFVSFGLIRLFLMNYIIDIEKITKKDKIFMCILVILFIIFFYIVKIKYI